MANDDLRQVSNNSIGRTVPGLIDPETGIPLDKVVPVLGGNVVMYDADGNHLPQATRCHRAPAAALAHHYWPRALRDLLKAGFLQGGVCPHAPREQLAGKDGSPKASMPAPKGYTFCDGAGSWSPPWSPDAVFEGCDHLAKAVAARHKRAVQLAKARKNGSNYAAASALAEQMAKAAIIGANANAARDKGMSPTTVGKVD